MGLREEFAEPFEIGLRDHFWHLAAEYLADHVTRESVVLGMEFDAWASLGKHPLDDEAVRAGDIHRELCRDVGREDSARILSDLFDKAHTVSGNCLVGSIMVAMNWSKAVIPLLFVAYGKNTWARDA